jgi:hypothetical protein
MHRFVLRGLVLGLLASLALLPALRSPQEAGAIYHIAFMNEVMVGYHGDPDVQYVEVRMELVGQHIVHDTRLTYWTGTNNYHVLLQLDRDVPNEGAGVHWIMATQAFADLTGLTPDFIIPTPTEAARMPSPTGMICWGGPDFAPPPDQWDPAFPFWYTDCVSYGSYTGGNEIHSPPTTLPPGDGTMSLHRMQPPPTTAGEGSAAHMNAPPDIESWFLRCPSPENNAGDIVLLGDESDADGLPDCHEGEAGTDPALPDTDGDSYQDGEEYLAGSDPLDPESLPGLIPTPTPQGMVGDASCDRQVNAIDSALVLQQLAGMLAGLPCPENADASGGGGVNAIDAAVILQYAAGLVPSLPP